ncbi:MAG TPA: class I SAM-dependent methyltransferase [Alphaproteobacteria bacterium]|nr:class I SAM-dependent methyltransferase [Alphaproteobacteria bacterium]
MKDFYRPISVREDVRELSEQMFLKYLRPDHIVYDIGCGDKPFAEFLKGRVKAHIGVDLADGFYDPAKVDVIATAYDVPADDGCADAVISAQVIEHLETPLRAIDETYRLLKPGGLFFLSFPFLHPIHAAPRDFMRYTEYYVRQEIAGERFEIVEMQRIGGFWYMMGMYLGIYLYQFDKGIIKRLRLIPFLHLLASLLFRGIGFIERVLLRAAGTKQEDFDAKWTLNYVFLLRKKEKVA